MSLKYIVYNDDHKRPYVKILISGHLSNPPFYRNRGSIQLYMYTTLENPPNSKKNSVNNPVLDFKIFIFHSE